MPIPRLGLLSRTVFASTFPWVPSCRKELYSNIIGAYYHSFTVPWSPDLSLAKSASYLLGWYVLYIKKNGRLRQQINKVKYPGVLHGGNSTPPRPLPGGWLRPITMFGIRQPGVCSSVPTPPGEIAEWHPVILNGDKVLRTCLPLKEEHF